MRTLRVLRNVVTNYLRFGVTGLVGFLLTPIMVHVLGDGDYGLWVAVFSLTGYFGLFDQGIRPSLVRYVSRDHARGDQDGLNRTITSAFVLYGSVGILAFAATAGVASGFATWFNVGAEQLETARAVVWLAGISVAIGFPFGVFGAVLSGLQRYDIGNAIGIGVAILRAFVFVAVMRSGGGVVGLASASLAMNVTGHVLSWLMVRRQLPGLRMRLSAVSRERLRLIGSYSGIAFVGALATSIAFQTDALVITAFLGTAFVTPFALAAGLVDNARTLVHSATWVLSPTASELETKGEAAKLHEMMIAGCKYSVLVSWPVLAALILFGESLLATWVGDSYRPAARLLAILAAPTALSLPQSAMASILFGVGRHRGVVAISLLNALLNLGLSLLWVRWSGEVAGLPLGLVGVALGTALPLAFLGGFTMMIFGCRSLDLPLRRYVGEGLLKPGLASLAFVLPAVAVQMLLHPVGWVPLGVAVAACWIPFAVCAWRFALNATERARWKDAVARLSGARRPAPAAAAQEGTPS